jgi:hypothetical protein
MKSDYEKRARRTAWKEAHRDTEAAASKAWRDANPGAQKEANRRWFEKDPDHARKLKREAQARYRARRKKERGV